MPDSKSEGEAAGRRVDAYLETAKRLEPEITMIDRDYTLTSIAISLKRIADALENIQLPIQDAIYQGTTLLRR